MPDKSRSVEGNGAPEGFEDARGSAVLVALSESSHASSFAFDRFQKYSPAAPSRNMDLGLPPCEGTVPHAFY